VSGEGTDPTFVTAMNSRLFQQAIEGRLQATRGGAPLLGAAGGQNAAAAPTERAVGNTVWGIALGAIGSGDYLQDADLRTGGFVLGADRDLGKGWVAGGAIGYVRTTVDPGPGGSADVASLELAGYANWTDGAWFANGLAGLGHHWLDIDRRVTVGGAQGTASSSPDASGVFLAATAGRRFDLAGGLALEPLLGLRYDHVSRDGYEESGAAFANRSVDAESLNAAQVFAGLRAYADRELADGMRLRPEFDIGYAREIGDTDIVTGASLLGAPGAGFTVLTEGPGDNVGIVGLRLAGAKGALSFFLDYRAEIRAEFTGHVARAGLGFAF
jgi:outer membrane autotransporter protein